MTDMLRYGVRTHSKVIPLESETNWFTSLEEAQAFRDALRSGNDTTRTAPVIVLRAARPLPRGVV